MKECKSCYSISRTGSDKICMTCGTGMNNYTSFENWKEGESCDSCLSNVKSKEMMPCNICDNFECWRPKEEKKEEVKCIDCGKLLNDGEAKTFTCCDNCWAKHYNLKEEVKDWEDRFDEQFADKDTHIMVMDKPTNDHNLIYVTCNEVKSFIKELLPEKDKEIEEAKKKAIREYDKELFGENGVDIIAMYEIYSGTRKQSLEKFGLK